MLNILFFLCLNRKNLNFNILSKGSYAIEISKLQNASIVSDKKTKSTNIGKYYIISIKNEKPFFESDLFHEFRNIFTPFNCIHPLHFRYYLTPKEAIKLQKSQYLALFEIPKKLKYLNSKYNSKFLNNNKIKSQSNKMIQYLVQATNDFPIFFQKYGVVRKMFDELYSFTLISDNLNQSFNSYVKNVKNALKNSDLVFLFELSPKINMLNRFSIGYVQTGTYEMKNYNNIVTSYNPLHELQLKGENEVVTITDSGVTPGATWFIDSAQQEYPYNKYDPNQRKIVYYATYSNRGVTDQTDYSGHGTHVAGTVLGNSQDTNPFYSLFNGAAPNAKAIIVDLEDGYGSMRVDINLQQTLNRMKSYNSFINTNSWGLEVESLTVNYLYNSAAISYPEFLFIFASGNDGRFQSINSPGSLKNVLTVGALNELKTVVLNSTQNVAGKGIQFDVLLGNSQTSLSANSLSSNENFKATGLQYKSLILQMSNKNKLDTIYNTPVESYSASASSYTGKAVIVSDCSQASDSISKGAKAIIVNSMNTLLSSQCVSESLQAQTFALELPWSSSDFQSLPGKTITITPQVSSSAFIDTSATVASYSSRGPNSIGAIKPEIVAPGTHITSSSRDSFSTPHLAVMSGTSMATPLVAGSLAILRQYLKEKKGLSADKIYSHLLKAIAVASADKPHPKVPDFEYGFGCLNLANVIPEITSNSNLKMEFLTDLKMNVETTYTFTFEVTSTNLDVRVAFSYLDAASQYGEILNIKANLNIQTPDKRLLFPLGDLLEDSFSSVERIYIPKEELATGVYTIVISTSEAVFNEIINASVVVSGPIRNLAKVETSGAFDWSNYCIVGNTVSSGKSMKSGHNECKCDQFSSGLLCQHKAKRITFGDKDAIRLSPLETSYFYSVLEEETYENIIFHWEQLNNQENYIMLRLSIAQSNKRLSKYNYFFASNKSIADVSGPASSDGSSILYSKGTPFFFTYTNYGPTQVVLTVSSSIQKKENTSDKKSAIGVTLSVTMYLAMLIIIIVIIIIIFITCKRRRRRNAQVDGATSSSVSSSSGSNINNNNSENRRHHRRRRVNDNESDQEDQENEPNDYTSIPAYVCGSQMNINPYYNDASGGYDPSSAFYQPSYDASNQVDEKGEDNENLPQYFPPENIVGSNEAIPLNPYSSSEYQTQEYNRRYMYDY